MPIAIPIHYNSYHRIEQTAEDTFQNGKIYAFDSPEKADDYVKDHGGLRIHEQGKEIWYVFPSDIAGKFEVVSSMENS